MTENAFCSDRDTARLKKMPSRLRQSLSLHTTTTLQRNIKLFEKIEPGLLELSLGQSGPREVRRKRACVTGV